MVELINFGMTAAQLKKLTQEDVIQKYEEFLDGRLSKENYQLFFLRMMENFIKKKISTYKRTLGAEYEDLMSSAREMVVRKLESYDPTTGVPPANYFSSYIDEGLRSCVRDNQDKHNEHYQNTLKRADRAAKEAGFTGYNDPRLSKAQLAVLVGSKTLLSIERAIQYGETGFCSIDAFEENIGDYSKSPEKMFAKKETSRLLREQICKCDEIEKLIILMRVIEERSFKEIVKYLELHRDTYNLPPNIHQNWVEQKLSHALRKIKNDSNFRRSAVFQSYSGGEQASDEDIANMFQSDDSAIDDYIDLSSVK